MKGLSQTLLIVITAVVILVAALVLLTIFGGGVTQVATITQAESLCMSTAQMTCTTSSAMPANWNAPTVRVAGGNPQSCSTTCSGGPKNCGEISNGCKSQ